MIGKVDIMNKRNGIILVVLLLVIGTGSFVFADSSQEKMDKTKDSQVQEKKKEETPKYPSNSSTNGSNLKDDDEEDETNDQENGILTLEEEDQAVNSSNGGYQNTVINRPANSGSNVGGNSPSTPSQGNNTGGNGGSSNDGSSSSDSFEDDHQYDNALKEIENFEQNKTSENLQNAWDAINALPEGEKKEELKQKLEKIELFLKVQQLMQEFSLMMEKASCREDIIAADQFQQRNHIKEAIISLKGVDWESGSYFETTYQALMAIILNNDILQLEGLNDGDVVSSLKDVTVRNDIVVLLDGEEIKEIPTSLDEGKHEFILRDASFHEAKIEFFIDTTAPIVEGIEDQVYYNAESNVQITVSDTHNFDYFLLDQNGKAITYNLGDQFLQDGSYEFYAIDEAGNESKHYHFVIDTVLPTASIRYSTTEETNGDVVVTLENESEPITILNNDGSAVYTFNENGSFEFEIQDRAGNKNKILATVNNIKRNEPVATDFGILNYSALLVQGDTTVADIADEVWVFLTFSEKLKTAPMVSFYNVDVLSEFNDIYSTDSSYVYLAKFKLTPDIPEGTLLVKAYNYESVDGIKGKELQNDAMLNEKYQTLSVVHSEGFDFTDQTFFNQREIVVKDPDFSYMKIRCYGCADDINETVYTNRYVIPEDGTVFKITVYNQNNKVIYKALKTYDGDAPMISGIGVTSEGSEEIVNGSVYSEVNVKVTDVYLSSILVTLNGMEYDLSTFDYEDAMKKYQFTEPGEYQIIAKDRAENESKITFIIQ